MKKLHYLLIVLLLGMPGISCRSTSPTQSESTSDIRGKHWNLYQYSGADMVIHSSVDSGIFSFYLSPTFDTIGGVSRCNSFGGLYLLAGNDLTVPSMITSLVACPLTEQFEEAIQKATIIAADSSSLTLQSQQATMQTLWFKVTD